MAQTHEGALQVCARKAGLSVEDYVKRRNAGEKWCMACKEWHPVSEFGKDSSRYDGLVPLCNEARRERRRKNYVPRPPVPRGRSFVPARDGDKKQARRRINYFVEANILPQPNALPCVDCGHTWSLGGRRHEYDHHLGYDAKHHEDVEPVCSKCHRVRAIRRKEWRRK